MKLPSSYPQFLSSCLQTALLLYTVFLSSCPKLYTVPVFMSTYRFALLYTVPVFMSTDSYTHSSCLPVHRQLRSHSDLSKVSVRERLACQRAWRVLSAGDYTRYEARCPSNLHMVCFAKRLEVRRAPASLPGGGRRLIALAHATISRETGVHGVRVISSTSPIWCLGLASGCEICTAYCHDSWLLVTSPLMMPACVTSYCRIVTNILCDVARSGILKIADGECLWAPERGPCARALCEGPVTGLLSCDSPTNARRKVWPTLFIAVGSVATVCKHSLVRLLQ